MQAEASGQEVSVEDAERSVVFRDPPDRSEALRQDHLGPAQQEPDPLSHPLRLLQQTAEAGHLLKQLRVHGGRGTRQTHGSNPGGYVARG